MNAEQEYLLEYLKDEFSDLRDIRVRPTPRTVPQRSPDLVQDLDDFEPPAPGVLVRVGSRDYLFPGAWVRDGRFGEVQRLVREIRERNA